jgi:hypothetical protein
VSSRRSHSRAKAPGASAGVFPIHRMARSLSGQGPRGPRRGAKGSCETPGTPCLRSPVLEEGGPSLADRTVVVRWLYGGCYGGTKGWDPLGEQPRPVDRQVRREQRQAEGAVAPLGAHLPWAEQNTTFRWNKTQRSDGTKHNIQMEQNTTSRWNTCKSRAGGCHNIEGTEKVVDGLHGEERHTVHVGVHGLGGGGGTGGGGAGTFPPGGSAGPRTQGGSKRW